MSISRFFKLMILFVIILTTNPLYAKSNSRAEVEIQKFVYAQNDSAINLLEKLVNINSGTMNVAGVYQVGELLRPEFEKLGFKTYWKEEPASFKRAGTLFAEHHGKSGKHILLIGHLDTVFPKESSFQKFVRHKRVAFGPGVVDDKGGDIVILYALKALNAVHALDDASITVALMGDEEDSGKPAAISRKALIDVARDKDVALDFECSLGLDTATIARRGISSFKIETEGYASHSANIFSKASGYGAIFEMTRILNSIRTQLVKEKYLSFNPGIILGGSVIKYDENHAEGEVHGKKNVISSHAIVDSDLRFISSEQKTAAQKQIQKIVAAHLQGTKAKVTFKDGIPAMSPTKNNLELLKLYDAVSRDLGFGKVSALDPGDRGAGDISYVAGIVPANLAGLGALSAGGGAHSDEEGIDLRSLPIITTRAAVLIYRLTKE